MGKKVHRRREVRRLLREELKKMESMAKQEPNQQLTVVENKTVV